jgi:hypothetical protein
MMIAQLGRMIDAIESYSEITTGTSSPQVALSPTLLQPAESNAPAKDETPPAEQTNETKPPESTDPP